MDQICKGVFFQSRFSLDLKQLSLGRVPLLHFQEEHSMNQ